MNHPIYRPEGEPDNQVIIECVKPVVHIKVKNGVLWSSPGTSNVFQGLSKTKRMMLKVRNRLWRVFFEKMCAKEPQSSVRLIYRTLNNWRPV